MAKLIPNSVWPERAETLLFLFLHDKKGRA
jgi:hypothetical protein